MQRVLGCPLTTAPLSNWELPEGFLAPCFPAVRGTSSNWPAGFALLTMQSDTPGVCLSLEKCLSVLELWRRRTQGCFHECFVFIDVFVDNLLWDGGCSGGASQHTVNEPGIQVPMDEGNLCATLSFRELPPWFLGEVLAPAAHPCSVSLPFLWQSSNAAWEPRQDDPAPCGGSCSICWDLSREGMGRAGSTSMTARFNTTGGDYILKIIIVIIAFII